MIEKNRKRPNAHDNEFVQWVSLNVSIVMTLVYKVNYIEPFLNLGS
jgi:hypothetical protein